MFGDAEAVVDRRIATARKQSRGGTHLRGRHAGCGFAGLGRIARLADKGLPARECLGLAARSDKGLVDQPFGNDHMRQRIEQGDIGAGPQLEQVIRLDMRRAHQIDAARIGDDQLGTGAQASFHLRGEHRMRVGWIRTDDEDHIGVIDRVEILGTGRFAERGLQSITGRRMADARTGIDIVVAERRAHEFLHEPGFLVGAAR